MSTSQRYVALEVRVNFMRTQNVSTKTRRRFIQIEIEQRIIILYRPMAIRKKSILKLSMASYKVSNSTESFLKKRYRFVSVIACHNVTD